MAQKKIYFNHNFKALLRMQAGVDKLSLVVGVTLGPKGRNVVLGSLYGGPRIVNDGVTVAKEVYLQDPVENIGVQLVRQAASKTNDLAGDGTTTAIVLASALISEGMKFVVSGSNPVEIVRGIEQTIQGLVRHIRDLSFSIRSDEDLMNIATVSAGNDFKVGGLITDALTRVGRQGVVTMQESRTSFDFLSFVEGMQFQRGYLSPYFVTDSDRMICEYNECRILLVDKQIDNARDMVGILETAISSRFPILIMAVDIEPEGLATLVVNKLRGNLQVVAVKAPGFGQRKTEYLEDVAIMTGATVVQDAQGVSLSSSDSSILGRASRVIVAKDFCTIVGDGEFRSLVKSRVSQVRFRLKKVQDVYEREKLQERIARLSGGVAIINVGASTEAELQEKKLRVEDALCATKAGLEEGIVVGGGCTLLRLSREANFLLKSDFSEDHKKGIEIVRKSLFYPIRLIAHNSGGNGSVVLQKVFESRVPNQGFNAINGRVEDLLRVGIIEPSKVVRCSLQNAGSVARTFLNSDCVVFQRERQIPGP